MGNHQRNYLVFTKIRVILSAFKDGICHLTQSSADFAAVCFR